MTPSWPVLAVAAWSLHVRFVTCRHVDQVPAAVTVYRNPAFFENLDTDSAYATPTPILSGEGSDHGENYKYPGETKKPNPTASTPGPPEVTYDDSPEFRHEPRDISVGTFAPRRRKGPYGFRYRDTGGWGSDEASEEVFDFSKFSQASVESGSNEDSGEMRRNRENVDDESIFNSVSDEKFNDIEELTDAFAPKYTGSWSDENSAESSLNQFRSPARYDPVTFERWKSKNYPTIRSESFSPF